MGPKKQDFFQRINKLKGKKIENSTIENHTIQKRKKMPGQNKFQNLLLNDANMIGEH